MAKRSRLSLDSQKLQQLLHKGGISMNGLADLVAALREDDLSREHVRKKMADANRSKFEEIRHSVELPLAEGGSWVWHFLDPAKLLASLIAESASLQRLYTQAWRRSPPSPENPWSLVVAYDEFVPGNKLATDHTRKNMVVSFSFLQLGQGSLSCGTVWATSACVRSNRIAEVSHARRKLVACFRRLPIRKGLALLGSSFQANYCTGSN